MFDWEVKIYSECRQCCPHGLGSQTEYRYEKEEAEGSPVFITAFPRCHEENTSGLPHPSPLMLFHYRVKLTGGNKSLWNHMSKLNLPSHELHFARYSVIEMRRITNRECEKLKEDQTRWAGNDFSILMIWNALANSMGDQVFSIRETLCSNNPGAGVFIILAG